MDLAHNQPDSINSSSNSNQIISNSNLLSSHSKPPSTRIHIPSSNRRTISLGNNLRNSKCLSQVPTIHGRQMHNNKPTHSNRYQPALTIRLLKASANSNLKPLNLPSQLSTPSTNNNRRRPSTNLPNSTQLPPTRRHNRNPRSRAKNRSTNNTHVLMPFLLPAKAKIHLATLAIYAFPLNIPRRAHSSTRQARVLIACMLRKRGIIHSLPSILRAWGQGRVNLDNRSLLRRGRQAGLEAGLPRATATHLGPGQGKAGRREV